MAFATSSAVDKTDLEKSTCVSFEFSEAQTYFVPEYIRLKEGDVDDVQSLVSVSAMSDRTRFEDELISSQPLAGSAMDNGASFARGDGTAGDNPLDESQPVNRPQERPSGFGLLGGGHLEEVLRSHHQQVSSRLPSSSMVPSVPVPPNLSYSAPVLIHSVTGVPSVSFAAVSRIPPVVNPQFVYSTAQPVALRTPSTSAQTTAEQWLNMLSTDITRMHVELTYLREDMGLLLVAVRRDLLTAMKDIFASKELVKDALSTVGGAGVI